MEREAVMYKWLWCVAVTTLSYVPESHLKTAFTRAAVNALASQSLGR